MRCLQAEGQTFHLKQGLQALQEGFWQLNLLHEYPEFPWLVIHLKDLLLGIPQEDPLLEIPLEGPLLEILLMDPLPLLLDRLAVIVHHLKAFYPHQNVPLYYLLSHFPNQFVLS